MRVLSTVVQRAILAVVDDEHPWGVLASFEQVAEEFLYRLLVLPALHENIEYVAVLVNGLPQRVMLLVHREQHFVQVPFISWLGAPTPELIGICLPELVTPFADGFVRHTDPMHEQEFFHIIVAQRKVVVALDSVAEDGMAAPHKNIAG